MIQLKSDLEVEKMRLAGLVVAEALAAVRAAVAPGVTLRELDAVADDEIRSRGAVPSFLDYLPGVGYVPRNDTDYTADTQFEAKLVPGDDLRVGELRDRPWHPRRSSARFW